MHVQDDHRYIYMHVRACHDTVHEYIYDQEHIMCSLYIQTLPQLEVYKQSTDGDMHAIGIGTSYPKNWKSSLQRSHACK